jgi:hypothetical protein
MTPEKRFTRSEIADFHRAVDGDDRGAWERFKLALDRVTGIPQPPKPRPAGWVVVSEPGW